MAAPTTTTTLAGIMETIVPDVQATFALKPNLIEAVYAEVADSANAVQFQTQAVPAVVSVQSSQGSALTSVANTSTIKTATLGTYPIYVTLGVQALGARNASLSVANMIAGTLARTVDTSICALFKSFSGYVGALADAMSTTTFFLASATLEASGYTGRKVGVFHPTAWNQIAQGILGYASPSSNASEIVTTGYMGNFAGVDIFVSPWVDTTDDETSIGYNNWMGFDHAIGFGYREPIIDVMSAVNPALAAVDFTGVAQFAALEVTDGAGVWIKSYKEAS